MKKAKLTREEIIAWGRQNGWHVDKWGHLQKTIMRKGEPVKYRFKLSSTALRYEVQVHHPASGLSKAENEWMRLASAYYKDLKIEDGILKGLKRTI